MPRKCISKYSGGSKAGKCRQFGEFSNSDLAGIDGMSADDLGIIAKCTTNPKSGKVTCRIPRKEGVAKAAKPRITGRGKNRKAAPAKTNPRFALAKSPGRVAQGEKLAKSAAAKKQQGKMKSCSVNAEKKGLTGKGIGEKRRKFMSECLSK